MAAVLCARGGYGAQRMVDLLDRDVHAAVPAKAFVGFSDVTVELGFGYGDSSLTVPLGSPAYLDATTGTLTFRVPALA